MIHGFGGTYSGLEDLSGYIQARHNILGIDLPGYGLSAQLHKRHSLKNYAEFLDDFCGSTEFHKIDVIGHSFGADIAIMFAAKYPNRVNKLVLLNPVLASRRPGVRASRFYYKLVELAPYKIRHRLLHNHLLTWMSDYVNFSHPSKAQKDRILRDDYISDHLMSDRPIIESYNSLLKTDFLKLGRKINAQTLIISGDKDKLSPPNDMAILSNSIKNSTLIIQPGEGHFMPLESPRKTAALIENLLSSER